MKRLIFSIIIVILTAAFLVLYALSSVRGAILNLNVSSINGIYANLDQFFCFMWPKFWGKFIYVTPASGTEGQLYGTIIVSSIIVVFVIIVDVIASIVNAVRKHNKEVLRQRLEDENEKLSSCDEAPASFSEINSNIGSFSNSAAPYVTLDKPSSVEEQAKVEINQFHYAPTWRIVVSIFVSLLFLFLLFLRFTAQTNIPGIYNVFKGLMDLPFIVSVNWNLDAFFSTLLSGIYSVQMASFDGYVWTWGQLTELVIELLVFALVWFLVLLVCHLIMKKIRKDKSKKSEIDIKEVKETISTLDKSMLGNSDLMEASKQVKSIAEITPFSSSVQRNQQLYEKAMYIDDIGEYVTEAGTKSSVLIDIPPSPTRQPLAPEELSEDLSKNASVTIKDIASIEDSFKKKEATISVEPTFVMSDDSAPYINLDNINLSSVANIEKKKDQKEEYFSTNDDVIAFDEDGFSYLVKVGKPFTDEQEDISDVVQSENLDKTAIIARFGRKNFDELNELEPFTLTPLDYNDEIKNIADRKKASQLVSDEELLRASLSKEPFKAYDNVIEEEKHVEPEVKIDKPILKEEPGHLDDVKPEVVPIKPIPVKPREETKPAAPINESKPTTPSPIIRKPAVAPSELDKNGIKPISPTHVSFLQFQSNGEPKVEVKEKKEEKVEKKPIKKDLTKVDSSFFVAPIKKDDGVKPKGPIEAKIISIEDYLGKKK